MKRKNVATVVALALVLAMLPGQIFAAEAGGSAVKEEEKYDIVGDFAGEGMRFAGSSATDKSGMIDEEGKVVIPMLYNDLTPFRGGYACAVLDNVDKAGKGDVTSYVYNNQGDVVLTKKGVFAQYYDGQHSILSRIAKTGEVMGNATRFYEYAVGDGKLEPVTNWYDSLNSDEVYDWIPDRIMVGQVIDEEDVLGLRQRYGYLKLDGQVVAPLIYDRIESQTGRTDNARIVWKITEEEAEIGGVKGMAATNFYGLLDVGTGKELVPCVYRDVWSQSQSTYNGTCQLFGFYGDNGKWALFDGNGKRLTEFAYDRIGIFCQGLLEVEKDGKVGFVDETGAVVFPLAYNQVVANFDGTIRLANYDKTGNTILNEVKPNPFKGKGVDIVIDQLADDMVGISIDNYWLYTKDPAFIENGRTMLPLRAISEALGLEVFWDSKTKIIDLYSDTKHISLAVGDGQAFVNLLDDGKEGKAVPLDAPAQIKGGRTFVPLRFISENFGVDVEWRSKTKDVMIYKKAAGISISSEEALSAIISQTWAAGGPSQQRKLSPEETGAFIDAFNGCKLTEKDRKEGGYSNLASYVVLELDMGNGSNWYFYADYDGGIVVNDAQGRWYKLQVPALNSAIHGFVKTEPQV